MNKRTSSRHRAVVVNDDATQNRILTGLLRKQGLDAEGFESVESALAAMDAGNPPDLIVTDLYMPGIDGWRFCRLLRSPEYSAFNDVPIMVVSATYSGEEAFRVAADLRANAFLSVPVDGKRFAEQVRILLDGGRTEEHTHVLIVEDGDALGIALKKAFESSGCDADLARTAADATRAFTSKSYHIAVLDYHLPDQNGDQLLAAFRQENSECVFVMMTTDPSPELALAWMRQGASAYVRKPFEPEYLIELCAKARREKSLLRVEDLLEKRTQELMTSRGRLQEAQRIAQLGRWEFDIATNQLEWSDTIFEIFEINQKEFGASYEAFLDAIHPDDREMVDRAYRESLEHRTPYDIEHRLLMKDGRVKWVNEISRTEFDAEGKAIRSVGIVQDITRRKEVQETLRLMAGLLDMAPNSITVHDHQGRYLYANRKTFEMHGYTEAEFMALSLHDIDVPESEALIEERMRMIVEKGEATFEVEHFRKDGTIIPLEVLVKAVEHGGVPAFLSIANDITQRKEADSERERLLIAIEQAGETILITDPEGVIQYVNPAFERSSGFSWDDAVGNKPSILKSGDQDDFLYESLWRTISSGANWQGRMVNRRKNGTLYTEDVHISPVFDTSGQIVNYVAVKRDITKELEVERQYRQAQKMEAIGQLTGGVAHDFNNLLQVINGATDMALADLEPQHPARSMLAEVSKAGQRAVRLVEQLLLFSRRQIMRPRATDLNAVIGDLLKMLRRIIGENIRLEWLPGRFLASVYADQAMMEQVVVNLCINARDSMPAGGTLTIETQNVRVDSDYCDMHTWAKPGRYVLLSITDTGCGMEPETLERIFEPFFSTKAEGKGTGLGLATVYGIVKQHEGMINAYSELGKGSTFKVYLPQCDRKAEDVGSMIQGVVRGGKETVLLAEDDAMVRNLAKTVLERAGYHVLLAKDGMEAMQLFEKFHDEVDVALLDVVMPNMGGVEAFEQMRALRPVLKALFVSGYSSNAIHTNFVLHQGVELLQKPYGPESLLRALRAVLDSG